MKFVKDKLKIPLSHRTIREFTAKPVDEEVVSTLMEVANRTATSIGMQSFSIIRIKDENKRQRLAEICNQEYVARAPELWVFIVDCYRNYQIAKEQNFPVSDTVDADRFFQGFTDGALAAQNVTSALESLGMGAVYLGSILNDIDAVIRLLNLPKFTFPILGIGFGYPNQEPQLKPRMDVDLKFFTDGYQVHENYLKAIEDYDQEMRTYYDLRDANRRVDSFSNQVVSRMKEVNPKRREIVQRMREQGFNLNLE